MGLTALVLRKKGILKFGNGKERSRTFGNNAQAGSKVLNDFIADHNRPRERKFK